MEFDQIPQTKDSEDEDSAPPAKKQPDRFSVWEDDPALIENKTVDDEIREYISTRLTEKPDPDNVLQWWRFNKDRFPALSKLARCVLCIPASSAPSERAFSVCGRIIEERRTCLAPQAINDILFLNSNMKR